MATLETDLQGRAASGIRVLTCMDSRIDPLPMSGLAPGDAEILRNAGARVADVEIRTLVPASFFLGVNGAMVVSYTDCRMTVEAEDEIHRGIGAARGRDSRGLAFLTTRDVRKSARTPR